MTAHRDPLVRVIERVLAGGLVLGQMCELGAEPAAVAPPSEETTP